MSRKRILVVLILSLLGVAFLADFAMAQNFGVNEVNSGLGGALASFDDPRVVAARFIQLALGFLGVLAVLLVMYAGFIWMTSGGSEDKISKAKKLLLNGVMGLIIILSAWAVTTWLLNKITSTLNGGGNDDGGGVNQPHITTGAGAIGACSIQNVYPNDGQSEVPRNTSIMATFKEELDFSSVCVADNGEECACDNATCNKINPENIRIFKDDLGDACASGGCPETNTNVTNALVSFSSDKKTLIIVPGEYLGSADGNTPYSVIFNDNIKKADGNSVFDGCGSRYLQFSFKVSNQLDLEPPLVLKNSLFPLPDNEKDIYNKSLEPKAAVGEITVNSCPQAYSPARMISVSDGAEIGDLNYKGSVSRFKVSVPAETPDKAQLFNGENGALLGIASFSEDKKVVFEEYFSLQVENYSAGSFWDIIISPERLADTIRVNSSVYTFSDSSVNNNIRVNSACSSGPAGLAAQAADIQAVLSGHPDVTASLSGNKVVLEAKVAGVGGNGLALSSSASGALTIKPFTGGSNKVDLSEAKDKEDRPRNSAIQLNFNEPVNPLTVSGSASEVASFIRITNYNSAAKTAGSSCSGNGECLSYKCDNSVCVGDYLDGKFTISNNYRTLEFVSSEECGKNACGETIYCLPANSHLKMEMRAANLKACLSDADCSAMNPFKSCLENTALGYKTCQNNDKKNYPAANIGRLDGIVDAAANSLDGNRSRYASGPIDFYNENTAISDKEDGYTWSFYVSDEIRLTPPQITAISPNNNQEKVSPADEIEIHFNTLMLNSTLVTGSIDIQNGQTTNNHKFINLRSSSPVAYGYWLSNDNIDIAPFDGEPDLTISYIKHTPFPESMTFYAQVGSGVKDIYQNCFKPSVGPDCPAATASCCFGSETTELDSDGNCLK